MTWYDLVSATGVISSGLIAGQMLAIAISNQANTAQPTAEWVRRFQLENKVFTRTMPPALLIPLAALVGSVFAATDGSQARYSVAAIGMAAVLLVTMIVNVPINRIIDTWSVEKFPPDWTEIRDRWLAWHWIRTLLGIVAFSVSAIARLVP